MFVALVLVLLAQAQDLPEDFHIETLSLGLCEDLLLASFNALISSSMCSTRSMNERMRSPGIPAVFVMPAPHFKRSYGRATKVTEKLMEPPEFPLRRALVLPLPPMPMHNRVAITGM